MNKLDTGRINEYAPYKVEMEDGQYIFETDHNILYGVSFDEETMLGGKEIARNKELSPL